MTMTRRAVRAFTLTSSVGAATTLFGAAKSVESPSTLSHWQFPQEATSSAEQQSPAWPPHEQASRPKERSQPHEERASSAPAQRQIPATGTIGADTKSSENKPTVVARMIEITPITPVGLNSNTPFTPQATRFAGDKSPCARGARHPTHT